VTESEADTIVEDIVNGRVGAVNGQEPKDYRHVPAAPGDAVESGLDLLIASRASQMAQELGMDSREARVKAEERILAQRDAEREATRKTENQHHRYLLVSHLCSVYKERFLHYQRELAMLESRQRGAV